MMAILSKEYNIQITLLYSEISNLELALASFAKHAQHLEAQTKLKDNLSAFNKNTLQKKKVIFWRDKMAFSEGREYKWNTSNTQTKKQYQPREQHNGTVKDFPSYRPK